MMGLKVFNFVEIWDGFMMTAQNSEWCWPFQANKSLRVFDFTNTLPTNYQPLPVPNSWLCSVLLLARTTRLLGMKIPRFVPKKDIFSSRPLTATPLAEGLEKATTMMISNYFACMGIRVDLLFISRQSSGITHSGIKNRKHLQHLRCCKNILVFYLSMFVFRKT